MARISFLACVFLIGLRLVIGWHFLFEGLHKVGTHETGPAEISKPFSSAGYFAEAEGPLGPKIREWIGDPDATALAKLKLAESGDDKPSAKMPVALAEVWDEYARQFENYYKLNDDDKKQVAQKLEQAKTAYVLWLTDERPKPKDGKKEEEPKKIKKTILSAGPPVDYEVDDKVQQRVASYKNNLAEVRDFYEHRLPELGNVEKFQSRVRALKTETAAMRAELMKDVDEHTKKMKESLAKIVAGKLDGFDVGPDDPQLDERVLALLTLRGEGTDATLARMPVDLGQQWNDYLNYVRENGHAGLRKNPQRAEEILNEAKLRFVRFLLDLDQYDGAALPEKEVAPRLEAYRKSLAKLHEAEKTLETAPTDENKVILAKTKADAAKFRKAFVEDIKRHTDILKDNLGGFSSDKVKDFDSYKGTVEPEKEKTRFLWRDWPTTKLEWLDWSARWGLLVAGGCMVVGLFTRLACLYCAVFLVIEFLSNPPFPWFPASPKAEGNYTFVNKNVVELMALLALASLPTGRWLGLDALVSRVWPFRRRRRK